MIYEGVLASKVAMSPAVSRLLARLINTSPAKIFWRIAAPRNSLLLRTATASARRLRNLLKWRGRTSDLLGVNERL